MSSARLKRLTTSSRSFKSITSTVVPKNKSRRRDNRLSQSLGSFVRTELHDGSQPWNSKISVGIDVEKRAEYLLRDVRQLALPRPGQWTSEKEIINAVLKEIQDGDCVVFHDPSLCHFLDQELRNHIVIVLHQDSPYYYSAVEEFGLLTDGIICVSGDIQNNISPRFQSKTITIGPSIGQTALRTSNNNQTDHLSLIFVAREDLNKGVQHLPIIDRILTEHGLQPQWTIVLGSRPEEVQSFRVWARANESRVTIQENIPNHTIPALIAQHDALILPSQTEGHPMVLIEALSQSIPPFSFYY